VRHFLEERQLGIDGAALAECIERFFGLAEIGVDAAEFEIERKSADGGDSLSAGAIARLNCDSRAWATPAVSRLR
jgi:hypothetical protein